MSSVHYFPRYTQRENVVTNNTLLLFSMLYNHSPFKFKLFLNEIIDESNLEVGVNFSQQIKAKNSIPDGFISQESFKITIETKLGKNFLVNQLTNHLESFSDEKIKILLALGTNQIDSNKEKKLMQNIIKFNSEKKSNVVFDSVTFKEVISSFREVIEEYDFELQSIINDYEDFCISEGLVRKDECRMLTVACGRTLSDNFKNNIYYAPAHRNYSYCSHLGLYHNKVVRGIGKIENIIEANLRTDNNELEIIKTTNDVITDKQKVDIKNIINDAKENVGWDIAQNHQFFCVNKFAPTQFRKITKGGLYGRKYFNLNKILNKNEFENIEEIANMLNEKKWQ